MCKKCKYFKINARRNPNKFNVNFFEHTLCSYNKPRSERNFKQFI